MNMVNSSQTSVDVTSLTDHQLTTEKSRQTYKTNTKLQRTIRLL